MDDEKQNKPVDHNYNDDEGIEYSSGEWELCPEDVHELKFTKFESYMDETWGKKRLRLIFETIDEKMTKGDKKGEPFELATSTSPSFSSRGRLRPMLEAMGVDVGRINLQKFKLSKYLGGRLRGTIKHVQSTKTPDRTFANIDGFLASKTAKRQPWEKSEEDEQPKPRREEDREPVAAGGQRKKLYDDTEED